MKSFQLIFLAFYLVLAHYPSIAFANCDLNNLNFVGAINSDREFLIQFAITAYNETYLDEVDQIVDFDRAREIFAISQEQIDQGLVEKAVSGTGSVLGFYSLKLVQDNKRIELGLLNVDRSCQGKGLGTMLFKRAVEVGKSLGKSLMQWISDPKAVGFYEKRGALRMNSYPNELTPSADPVVEFEMPLVPKSH